MEDKKREIGIDLNELIRKTYNKIAMWHNEKETDAQKSDMLKFISHEIVTEVLTEAFSQLEGVKTSVKLVQGEPKKKKESSKGLFSQLIKNKKEK